MFTLILSTDWIVNRAEILRMVSQDVAQKKENRILVVPELISHEMERRLCAAAGDTTSRFAEVLSFTRLANRVADYAGLAVPNCLDNGGRVVAMASAVRQLHSQLKAYASVETRPEFLTGLVEAVDEFKRCCIAAADLKAASLQTTGSLAQKLEELSLILECYDALCAQGKQDPRDQMTWLLNELEECGYAESHTFYIDGFPDFTRQHMEIIEHLIKNAKDVTISLTCDRPGSTAMAFEKAGETAAELIRCAKRLGVAVNICPLTPREDALSEVRSALFQGEARQGSCGECLQLYRAESIYQECVFAADQIDALVRAGARYRQIGIAVADANAYRNTIEMVFSRCNIPTYISGTEEILNKTVIAAVLNAIETALGGFEQRDVFQYMKSMLSPISQESSDRVEHYAVLWGINGNGWLKEWKYHPKGLDGKWTERYEQRLDELESARKKLIAPLLALREKFRSAISMGEQVNALYAYFEDIHLDRRLMHLADDMDAEGNNRGAQILNQLWDILVAALEQLYDVLGNTAWDSETFTRLLRLLLSQYDVGTIPSVLDSVTVGPVSAMQCQKIDYLFVLGALEGNLPGYSGSAGVLSDQERIALRDLGVPLTGGSLDGLKAEFAEIYGVFCGAQKQIYVTCPSGQPSFVYRRLSVLAGGDKNADCTTGIAWSDKLEAGAWIAANGSADAAAAIGVTDEYLKVLAHKDHDLGTISHTNVKALYGSVLNMSASQIDKHAQCRLSYFLRYGLHAEEHKEASVDPAEYGTYVHSVLENTAREIVKRGGFRSVSTDEALAIAAQYSTEYTKERFSQFETSRAQYLFERNKQELFMIVRELCLEMQHSEFSPVAFELGFGESKELPPIQIPGDNMIAQLIGVVDRVDAWTSDGQNFFRVVDYKTGLKDFDYCDVFNGMGLQMLLYLFALQQEGEALLGQSAAPAGVQYFPARLPVISVEGRLTDEEAQKAREDIWKRQGLLLNNDFVLDAMSDDETESRMPYKRKKDGTVSGNLASDSQFEILKKYILKILGAMVDDISSGCVSPNPYERGSKHSACTFCPYGSVCHKYSVEGRRNYAAMSASKFWEEVEKEVGEHG